ncbi:hypothetical protein MJT46_019188 [Ovis ammon polii x Ovis aries]|nr:hypothetical protein MJT46_019188 [Ovis ammon polii x Ovis aries]
MPTRSIRRILKVVQLDCVEDLEVNCTWNRATLGRVVLHLGQMGNLPPAAALAHPRVCRTQPPKREEHCITQLTAQFLNLPHL